MYSTKLSLILISLHKHHLVVLENGDKIQITSAEPKLRLLLISGKPIKEPVA